MAYQILLDQNLQDINPILAGSAFASITSCGPRTKKHFTLIHFVTAGSGTVHLQDAAYEVHKGQAFIIPAQTTAYLEPNKDDPWAFHWIGFTGDLAHKFHVLPPVFDIPDHILPVLCDPSLSTLSPKALSYRLSAELMLLCSHMCCNEKAENNDYVSSALEYIQKNYSQSISVEDLAFSLGLTRSYLTELFRKKTGSSIREYLLTIRIQAAKRYLMQGSTIKEAAVLCGIKDRSNFVKLFTRETGKSPTEWMSWVQSNVEAFEKEKTTK